MKANLVIIGAVLLATVQITKAQSGREDAIKEFAETFAQLLRQIIIFDAQELADNVIEPISGTVVERLLSTILDGIMDEQEDHPLFRRIFSRIIQSGLSVSTESMKVLVEILEQQTRTADGNASDDVADECENGNK